MENDSEQRQGCSGEWAEPVSVVRSPAAPARFLNANVDGRDVCGPLQGFGPMKRKTYTISLAGADPGEVVSAWKENFPDFWPAGNDIYLAPGGIAPGKVGLINLPAPVGPIRLATGIVVLYADQTSFTFITVAGHMFAGINNFSAFRSGDDSYAQVDVLIRTNDPLWETTMRMFGFRKEDAFWKQTLRAVAQRFGSQAQPVMTGQVVDPAMQWMRVLNVRYNAAILSGLYQFLPGWPRIARILGL